MFQPGVGRATAYGLLGFMTASLLVVIVRGLQNLSPVYDPSVGVVLGGFLGAIFFIWGIGAFNPLWSAHGEAEEEARKIIEEKYSQPRHILTSITWSLLGWLLLNETLDARFFIGAAFIISGLLIASLPQGKKSALLCVLFFASSAF